MSVTTEIRWMVDSLTEGTFSVVRITRTVERLAGPFSSIRHAKQWITEGRNQQGLFE